jgi:hypothetical protein
MYVIYFYSRLAFYTGYCGLYNHLIPPFLALGFRYLDNKQIFLSIYLFVYLSIQFLQTANL